MTDFAEALARIEELRKEIEELKNQQQRPPSGDDWRSVLYRAAEISQILQSHSDSIVQLAKVAAEMRAEIKTGRDIISGTIPQVFHVSTHGLAYACEAYDALMKKGGE